MKELFSILLRYRIPYIFITLSLRQFLHDTTLKIMVLILEFQQKALPDDHSWCASYLQEKQLPSTLNKTPSTCTFVSELVIHFVAGQLIVQPCTCKQYIYFWLLPHSTIQPLHHVGTNMYRTGIQLCQGQDNRYSNAI